MPDKAAYTGLVQIKASAGSGKTFRLTSDFLRLLSGAKGQESSGCRLAQTGVLHWPEVLAVTFTNRAATEMRERVLFRLKAFALSQPLSGDEANTDWPAPKAQLAVNSLLQQYSALNMRTIDSLIHLLVRLSALDLRLAPDFSTVFNKEALLEPVLDELAEAARSHDDVLRHKFRLACDAMLRAEHKGFLAGAKLRDKVIQVASLLLDVPEQHRESLNLALPGELEACLTHFQKDSQTKALALRQSVVQEKLKASAHLLNALESFVDNDASLWKINSALFEKDSLENCLNKGSAQPSKLALAQYESVQEALDKLKIQGDALKKALAYLPFVDLAQSVLQHLDQYQWRTRQIIHSNMAAWAGQILEQGGATEAFCRMGVRLQHILVDEFQDTSQDQWLAIKPLAVEALSTGGSLSLVGDVKQAIYGWRGGKASLFNEAIQDKDLLGICPQPKLIPLPINYRSAPEVVAWNNAFFGQLAQPEVALQALSLLLPENSDPRQWGDAVADLSQAFKECSQAVEKTAPGYVRTVPVQAESSSALEEAIEQKILEFVQDIGKRYAWGDICILARSNGQATKAAYSLLSHGIPVITEGSLLLGQHPLVAQCVSLLAFLDSPDHSLALWHVLSGALLPPQVNMGVETLREWMLGKSRGSLARRLEEDFPEFWEECFAPLYSSATLLTPYDTVQEIFRRWRVWERFPQDSTFLLRFLEVLHACEQKGLSDLSSFLEYWEAHMDEEKTPLPEGMNAVSILTIHKSKGLEFPVVLAPWHNFLIKPLDKLQFYQVENMDILSPPCTGQGELYHQQLAEQAREAFHLLYVTWTRAKQELYCFLPKIGKREKGMGAAIEYLLDTMEKPQACLQRDDGGLELGQPSPAQAPQNAHNKAEIPEPLFANVDMPENWRPMYWLPRLKIFRNSWQELTFDSARRGVLMHLCLEHLVLTGQTEADIQADVQATLRHAMDKFSLPITEKEVVAKSLLPGLLWYAKLPQAQHWINHGSPEHCILDVQGNLHRVDLLVNDGTCQVAVDYKSGYARPEYLKQLQRYRTLLEQSSPLPAQAFLVYLDEQRLEEVFADKASHEA